MNIVKDIFRAVYKRKFIYILLCIQFCISIISALSGYDAWDRHNKYKIQNTSYTRLSDTYEISISGKSMYELDKSGKDLIKGLKLKTNYKIGTFGVKNKTPEGFGFAKSDEVYFNLIIVSAEFQDIYALDVLEGNDDFDESKKQVIAGYNFKENYKLMDKITVDGQGEEYEIIGFLPKDAMFMDNSNLNNKLVTKDSNIYQVLGRILIQSKDDYKTTKENIIKVTDEYGVLKFYKTEKLLYEEDFRYKENLKDNLVLAIGTIIFSFSMFLCSLIIIINQSKRDFGIRIAYGAKKSNLYFYIIGQVLFIYLLSIILMSGLYFLGTLTVIRDMKVSFFEYFKIEYFAVINLVIISLIVLISIPIMVKIHKLTPSELIRTKG